MSQQFEALVAEQVLDIRPRPREEIVNAKNLVTASKQTLAQMRTEKAGST